MRTRATFCRRTAILSTPYAIRVDGPVSAHRPARLLTLARHRRLRLRQTITIYDEWLLRDHGASACASSGIEPKAYAAAVIAREGGPSKCRRAVHARAPTSTADYHGRGNDTGNGPALRGDPDGRSWRPTWRLIPRDYDRAGPARSCPAASPATGAAAADQFLDRACGSVAP